MNSHGEKISHLLRDRRILLLLFIILVATILGTRLRLGIEFAGGTQIPITLEREVSPDVMRDIKTTIETRLSKFGMTQVKVEQTGPRELYVTVPKSDEALLTQLSDILKKRGVYEGIVDGRVAIKGDDIQPKSIRIEHLEVYPTHAEWRVAFVISTAAAQHFAKTVTGKANYPLYMFLDRPKHAGILISSDVLTADKNFTVVETVAAVRSVLKKENDDILLFVLGDWQEVQQDIQKANITTIIIENTTSLAIRESLRAMNLTIIEKTTDEMRPTLARLDHGIVVVEWKAIGLLSAPTLNPSITNGIPPEYPQYVITGAAGGKNSQDMYANAYAEAKMIMSILSGGALPVNAIVGSITTIPPALGVEFFRYSVVGAVAAFLCVSLVVFLRYRTPKVILPIIFTGLVEIYILVCVTGGIGTLDLGAMAGIIAAAGTSVDDQIVITDEILKKERRTAKNKLEKAFDIVVKRCTVAIIAMVPLLFSGLVQIIGFAVAAIIGTFLGVLVTRPAYGAIIETLFAESAKPGETVEEEG